MRDKIFNFFLNIWNTVYLKIVGYKPDYRPTPKYNYRMEWSEFWKALWWGSYSQTEKLSYFDPSMVTRTPDDHLIIRSRIEAEKNMYTGDWMPYMKGVVMTKYPIMSRKIEVIAAISPSKGMWHAPFWTVAANPPGSQDKYAVLPEIDVAEVYTEGSSTKAEIKTNLHYGENYTDKAKSIKAKTHYIPKFYGRQVRYGLEWDDKRIKIFYDGRLVRRITDKSIIERMQHGVYLVMNTSVNPNSEFSDGYMEIRHVSYEK